MLSPKSGRLTSFSDNRGTAAVEFTLVAPAMILMALGILVFTLVLSLYSGLQQIAAEAARAALAGTSAAQETQFANQYVAGVLNSYSFIDPAKLAIATSVSGNTFQVTLTYDASGSFLSLVGASGAVPPLTIVRSASVQLAGF